MKSRAPAIQNRGSKIQNRTGTDFTFVTSPLPLFAGWRGSSAEMQRESGRPRRCESQTPSAPLRDDGPRTSAAGSDARRRDEGDAGAHRRGAPTPQTAPRRRNRLRWLVFCSRSSEKFSLRKDFLASRVAKGQTRRPHPFFSSLLKSWCNRHPAVFGASSARGGRPQTV